MSVLPLEASVTARSAGAVVSMVTDVVALKADHPVPKPCRDFTFHGPSAIGGMSHDVAPSTTTKLHETTTPALLVATISTVAPAIRAPAENSGVSSLVIESAACESEEAASATVGTPTTAQVNDDVVLFPATSVSMTCNV